MSTSISEIPPGLSNGRSGVLVKNSSICRRQIGAAPETPLATFFICLLSLLPTHTPTTASRLQPIVQLSFRSLVVPVLTATARLPKFKYELTPKVSRRALLSARIELIRKATFSSNTLSGATGLCSNKVLPFLSTTFKMATGVTFRPPLAKAPYAAARSKRRTSPPPRASDRPRRAKFSLVGSRVSIPIR